MAGTAESVKDGKPLLPRQFGLFVSGTEGYHTFRIPALVLTNKGTVLAFCEGRKKSRRDDGDIDLMLKRSLDGGKTWQKMQLVHEEGGDAPITIGNPCPIVDRATGTIHLAFTRNNRRAFHSHSADDGATWATPTEITNVLKPFDFPWKRVGTGPGHGNQLRVGPHKGRLLVPLWLHDTTDNSERTALIYSDDGGNAWKPGGLMGPQGKNTDEAMAFETADGRLCLNMRAAGCKKRTIAWSRDGGLTWTAPRHDDALVCPVCQASVLEIPGQKQGESRLVLFANPASTSRVKLTVRLSRDEGTTWPAGRILHTGPAAYSDLVLLPDGGIGCLYERGAEHAYETITFARLTLNWLTEVSAPPEQ